MMCFLDTTFCNRKDYKHYEICGMSLSQAMKWQETTTKNSGREPLPYAVRAFME